MIKDSLLWDETVLGFHVSRSQRCYPLKHQLIVSFLGVVLHSLAMWTKCAQEMGEDVQVLFEQIGIAINLYNIGLEIKRV